MVVSGHATGVSLASHGGLGYELYINYYEVSYDLANACKVGYNAFYELDTF
jgi:hypothetical protein